MTAGPLDLAFDVAGAGPPVLLLHGLFASSANWREVAAGLAARHRVYSLDLRNHGRSPHCADMSYLAMADDVLRLIERQGLQRPAVVGHSMGGKVAMALALTAPWAVGRLAVIDVAPLSYVDRWPNQLQRVMATLLDMPPPSATAVHAALAHWMIPRAAGHAYVDWRSNLGAIAVSLHELCAFPLHLRHLSTPLPLHAIAGGRSDWVQPLGATLFQPMFPNARVEVIEGAGHWVHADRPQALLHSLWRILTPAPRCTATLAAA